METTPKKRKSIKDDLEELRAMRRRSQERQNRSPVSEGGNETGSKAMKMQGSEKNFQVGGYKSNTKIDESKLKALKPSSGSNTESYRQEQVKAKPPAPREEKKPTRRPGAGREDAMNRYMDERKRRKEGQSRVIG
jgi:hypothetical protein